MASRAQRFSAEILKQGQWHSCRRYTLDETFARSAPPVRELFESVREMVESVGPVHVQAYREKVAFLVRVRFIAALDEEVMDWIREGYAVGEQKHLASTS